MLVGSLRLVSLFAVALLVAACAVPTPTATPTPYPESTPAPSGHTIGNWEVYDAEQDGTGDRLHGITTVSSEYAAVMVIRCNEQNGLELGIEYFEEFDPYEESVSVGGVINGEERRWTWYMGPSYTGLSSATPDAIALWLQENADESLFFSAEPASQPGRYDKFDLTGIDKALWQVLPCDKSKFVNFDPPVTATSFFPPSDLAPAPEEIYSTYGIKDIAFDERDWYIIVYEPELISCIPTIPYADPVSYWRVNVALLNEMDSTWESPPSRYEFALIVNGVERGDIPFLFGGCNGIEFLEEIDGSNIRGGKVVNREMRFEYKPGDRIEGVIYRPFFGGGPAVVWTEP